jgi:hypothetical protein
MGCTEERLEPVKEGPTIKSYAELKQALAAGKKLVVYEDQVIDVTAFIDEHPGGPKAIEPYVGKARLSSSGIGTEIGRYIYGSFGPPGKTPHGHGAFAFEFLEKLKCGQITTIGESKIFRPRKEGGLRYFRDETWTIVNCNMHTSVHAVIQFTNPNYKAAAILPGIDYCGKYFAVLDSPSPLALLQEQEDYAELCLCVHAELGVAE